MRTKRIISLVAVPLLSLGFNCLLPKKATAEIFQTNISTAGGTIPVTCDTYTQECYTPQNGEWSYVGTTQEVEGWQRNTQYCWDTIINGPSIADTGGFRRNVSHCGRYGVPESSIRLFQQRVAEMKQQVEDLIDRAFSH